PQYRSPAKALSNAGECSTRLRKDDDAKRYLASAYDHDPMQPETNTRLGRMYYRLGELSQARSYLNIALRSENPSAQALWLGLNLERKAGDSATAASLGAQLRSRHPASREYAALLRGQFDE